MASRLKAIRVWIAHLLLAAAYRISPAETLPQLASADVAGGSGTRFKITRKVPHAPAWTLYNGRNGGEARRIFEGVQARNELGSMELAMHDGREWVVRGRYEGKA